METKEFNIEEEYVTKAKNYFGYLPEAQIYKFESWGEARKVEWINERLKKENFTNEGGCFLKPNIIILIDKEAYYHEMAHLVIKDKLQESLSDHNNEIEVYLLNKFLGEVFAEYSATKILGKSMFIKNYAITFIYYIHAKTDKEKNCFKLKLTENTPYAIGALLTLGGHNIHKGLEEIFTIVHDNFEFTNSSINIRNIDILLKILKKINYK